MRRLHRFLSKVLRQACSLRTLEGLALVGGLLLVASTGYAAGGGHGGELHVNWWTWDDHAPPVGWFIIDFAVFVGLLVYFTKKPIAQAFEQRHATIKRSLQEAEEAHGTAKADFDAIKHKLATADATAKDLVAAGHSDGGKERDRIVQAAESYASRLRTDSESVASQEQEQARHRLYAAAVSDALGRAQSMIRNELSDADRERLLELAIVDLEQQADRVATDQPVADIREALGGAA